MTKPDAYGVLLSCASEMVTPGLIESEHVSRMAASEAGSRIVRASGVRAKVVERVDGEWSSRGVPVRAVLQDGIDRHWLGWL